MAMVSERALKNAPVTPERNASGAKMTTVDSEEAVSAGSELGGGGEEARGGTSFRCSHGTPLPCLLR